MRQGSVGGHVDRDERTPVFADLAEFRTWECSTASFDCCILNLLLYNEPVLYWKSTSRIHKESQLYLHQLELAAESFHTHVQAKCKQLEAFRLCLWLDVALVHVVWKQSSNLTNNVVDYKQITVRKGFVF